MATPSRRAQRKGKRMSEEYIAAAKTLAAQARQHRVHLLSGNVAFDWDTEQVEADIYAALTAAYLAGRIKQAEEISEMAEILAEAYDVQALTVSGEYKIAESRAAERAIGEFATSIRAVADRLRAEGEGEPK